MSAVQQNHGRYEAGARGVERPEDRPGLPLANRTRELLAIASVAGDLNSAAPLRKSLTAKMDALMCLADTVRRLDPTYVSDLFQHFRQDGVTRRKWTP